MVIDKNEFAEGWTACIHGLPQKANPYSDNEAKLAWERGWLSCHKNMMLFFEKKDRIKNE